MSRRLPLALLLLLLAAPAASRADRRADGRLEGPRTLRDRHVTATLPGTGWKQLLGALEGTPLLGSYARTLKGGCRVQVTLLAMGREERPEVRVGRVYPRRTSQDHVRIRETGRRGAVTWWSGTDRNGDAAAVGVQRAPASLDSPWVVYRLWSSLTGPSACARTTLPARTALTVARTMRLAPGPAVSRAPFDTA